MEGPYPTRHRREITMKEFKRYRVFKRFDANGNHKYCLEIPLKVRLDFSNGHRTSKWGAYLYATDLLSWIDNMGNGRAA